MLETKHNWVEELEAPAPQKVMARITKNKRVDNGEFRVVVPASIPLYKEMDRRYSPRNMGYAVKYPLFAKILAL
jgi:hypothetical protein